MHNSYLHLQVGTLRPWNVKQFTYDHEQWLAETAFYPKKSDFTAHITNHDAILPWQEDGAKLLVKE